MINVEKISEEVFVACDSIVQFGSDEIVFVKQKAQDSPLRRARICAHKTNEDALHEMLIAICADSYIHPHKHFEKSESFHIIEGEVDVVIFDELSQITNVIQMGAPESGRQFFYRLSAPKFHTLLIRSDVLVMHEVTNGPFRKDDSVYASFAPSANREEEAAIYIESLNEQVAAYSRGF